MLCLDIILEMAVKKGGWCIQVFPSFQRKTPLPVRVCFLEVGADLWMNGCDLGVPSVCGSVPVLA